MPKTKIFISSVNDDGLKPLRKTVFNDLTRLGHEPLMWEENLGPWPAHMDPIVKCLEAVEDSHVYLLFISNKGGTYEKLAGRTVTHLEFIKAFDKKKTILVFAEARLKHTFFSKVKLIIEQYYGHFVTDTNSSPTLVEIIDVLQKTEDIPKEVDPYIWYFLYDMNIRKVYIEDLSLGVQINWKGYFSDLLRRGVMLLPLENFIQENQLRLEQQADFFDIMFNSIPHIQIAGFRDTESFLNLLMHKVYGGIVQHNYGQYLSEEIGSYDNCSAVTLYVLDGDRMKLMHKIGAAIGELYYMLDNKDSFVVITNTIYDKDSVFYIESKQTFYYCIPVRNYVLTFHFPCGPHWDNHKFMVYKESVNYAIINKNSLISEFIKLLLGGMPS